MDQGKRREKNEAKGNRKIKRAMENHLHLEPLFLPSSAAPGISLGSILGLGDGRLH